MAPDKVIDKIRKLLELSKSTNEHEAASAAAHAARLMLDNQIEEADLEASDPTKRADEPIAEEAIGKDGRKVQWRSTLAYGIAKSLGARMYNWTLAEGVEYRIVAPRSTMDAVRYLYTYLTGEIDRLADTAFANEAIECQRSGLGAPSARAWKASFRYGAADMIAMRLTEERTRAAAAAREAGKGQALIVIDQRKEAIAAFVQQAHPGIRFVKGKRSLAGRASASGFQAGRAAGAAVHLGGGPRLGSGAKQIGGG